MSRSDRTHGVHRADRRRPGRLLVTGALVVAATGILALVGGAFAPLMPASADRELVRASSWHPGSGHTAHPTHRTRHSTRGRTDHPKSSAVAATSMPPTHTATATATARASASATAKALASATASASASSSSTAAPGGTAQPIAPAPASRLFAPSSPWNTPIASGAASDPESSQIVSSIFENPSLVVNTILYYYGIPFYTATSSTPRVTLTGGRPLTGVPLDPSWTPNPGADHKMNVFDPATSTVWELQGIDPKAHTVQWAVVRDYRTALADGYPADGLAGPTGSGLSQSAGVIRISEIQSGAIDHALSFITSRPVAGFRYPASHSDGSGSQVGLQEGMRIQLDPTLDLASIPGITKGELAIGRALQVYGAFCSDSGGGNDMAAGFYAERPTSGPSDAYSSVGLMSDWAQLPHIPKSRFRVLASSATPRP